MRISGGSVGPRGLALLLVTAVAGIVLAAHGWSGRQAGLTPGALSDLTLRDVGVLGLAVCLTAATRQRLVLSR